MALDLFAGVAVSDLPRAVQWFDRFFGEVESFQPNYTERVWSLAEHCHVYVELQPEHAGHSIVTVFVDDFDGFLEAATGRGLDPQTRETYGNGVRKANYRDPDGNQIGIGGPPAAASSSG